MRAKFEKKRAEFQKNVDAGFKRIFKDCEPMMLEIYGDAIKEIDWSLPRDIIMSKLVAKPGVMQRIRRERGEMA